MLDRSHLIDDVRQIMATTFRLDEADLTDDVNQLTCARWTSLNHMTLLVALEERFDVTFSMQEMAAMTSLPLIVGALAQRSA